VSDSLAPVLHWNRTEEFIVVSMIPRHRFETGGSFDPCERSPNFQRFTIFCFPVAIIIVITIIIIRYFLPALPF